MRPDAAVVCGSAVMVAARRQAPGRVCQSLLLSARLGLRCLSLSFSVSRVGDGLFLAEDDAVAAGADCCPMKLFKVAVNVAICADMLAWEAIAAAWATAASCCIAEIIVWMDSISVCWRACAFLVSSWKF